MAHAATDSPVLVFASGLLGVVFGETDVDGLVNLTGAISAFFFLALFPALIALQLLGKEYFGWAEHVEDGDEFNLVNEEVMSGSSNGASVEMEDDRVRLLERNSSSGKISI